MLFMLPRVDIRCLRPIHLEFNHLGDPFFINVILFMGVETHDEKSGHSMIRVIDFMSETI